MVSTIQNEANYVLFHGYLILKRKSIRRMSVRPGLFISNNTDLSFAIALKVSNSCVNFKIPHIYRVFIVC